MKVDFGLYCMGRKMLSLMAFSSFPGQARRIITHLRFGVWGRKLQQAKRAEGHFSQKREEHFSQTRRPDGPCMFHVGIQAIILGTLVQEEIEFS